MASTTEPATPPNPAPPESPPRAVVLYDGKCAFCQRGVKILKRLDWRDRLSYQDCRDIAHLPPCEEALDPRKLLQEMHVVTTDRQHAHAGYRAFRWMAWRLPPLWLIAPLMYIPGMLWIGNKLYLWVARNRYKIVPCKDGVCSLHQHRS